jgi:glycosyltransferase involved in cell wall biosynthesis
MIEHQQNYFDFDIKSKSIVIPDPIVVDNKKYPAPDGNNIFLYLGSFYGSRKPDSLISGFKIYASENSNAILQIVGNNKIDLDIYDLEASIKDRIKLIGWVDDVDKLIAMSAVLVDVDTDKTGDVFLSSKIKKYLPVNRPILSITSKNSPAEQLLKAFNNSVVISDHNFENVAKAMHQSMNHSYNSDSFLEREIIIKEMSIENSLDKIMFKFNQLIKK